MRLLILLASLASTVFGGCVSPPDPAPGPADLSTIPASHAGRWQGDLQLLPGPGRPARTARLALEIGRTPDADGHPWRLTYECQPTRDHRLRVVDARRGEFLIDERNGVTMPARLLGDTLVPRFIVAGQVLVTRLRLLDDRIEHEILAGPAAATTTGAGVDGLTVTGLQRAILVRDAE